MAEPILLQDETQTSDSKKLSLWFASKPDARMRAREAAAAISQAKLLPPPSGGGTEEKS